MNQLQFRTPAGEWMEGLPLGNGRIGCMMYGLPGKECFSFNADSLFRHQHRKSIRTAEILPDLRRLVAQGRGTQADALFQQATAAVPEACNAYQPFMDLTVECREAESASDYRRFLDLDAAVAAASYRSASGAVRWEAFASAADQLLVLQRISAQADRLHIRVFREEDPDCRYSVERRGDTIVFQGCFESEASFGAVIRLLTDGTLSDEEGGFGIEGARRLEIRVAMYTEYETAAPLARCETDIAAAAARDIRALRQAHEAEYRALYEPMSLSLGRPDGRDTQTLYQEGVDGCPSPGLYEQLFCFARYLLISSSRPGCLPVNLQGLWNHDLHPMWCCGYTTDMNIQMAYWIAEPSHLSHCHLALFDWIDAHTAAMEQQCREIFGAEDAAYIPQYTDAFMVPTCERDCGPFQVLWSGAAPWLARHYYEHWKYTGDDAFARQRAFPFMKRCMNFYLQMLQKTAEGRYRLAPACNPENWAADGGQLIDTATMDIALVHELARHLLEMNSRLDLQDPLAQRWEEIDAHMEEYPVDEKGVLREWVDSREPLDPMHRHLSHLYGIFPAHLFDGDARLEQAALRALDKRTGDGLEHSSSWSFAWYACMFARLGMGERALTFLDHLVHGGLLPNLLTVHNDWRPGSPYLYGEKIFQLDALLGAAAAICEMLVSAQEDKIVLLPSLPERWKAQGHVRGLCLPGGMEISFSWSDGAVSWLEIKADRERPVAVQFPQGQTETIQAVRRKECAE